jgi:hypothetical protein
LLAVYGENIKRRNHTNEPLEEDGVVMMILSSDGCQTPLPWNIFVLLVMMKKIT